MEGWWDRQMTELLYLLMVCLCPCSFLNIAKPLETSRQDQAPNLSTAVGQNSTPRSPPSTYTEPFEGKGAGCTFTPGRHASYETLELSGKSTAVLTTPQAEEALRPEHAHGAGAAEGQQ